MVSTMSKKVKHAIADAKRALARVRKAAVAVAGGLAELIALNVLHGTALHYAEAALTGLTAMGVYRAPNAPKRPAWL